jgi:hypothetical protein
MSVDSLKILVIGYFFSLISLTTVHAEKIFYQVIETKDFSKKELKELWKVQHTPQVVMPIRTGFKFVDLVYETTWHDGTKIKASGFLMVPTESLKLKSSELIYLHGTKMSKARGINLGNGEQFICASFAAEGYVVYFPDYIGLGRGEKFHLYQHAATQSSSSLDFIRAARQYLADVNYETDKRLYITGYSQGGHAAMGLHKTIQETCSKEFDVAASSPMSGAYDMSGVQRESMFRPYEFPSYFPYLMRGFDEVYDLFDEEFHTLFKAPYDTIVRDYYNGDYEIWEINPLLPEIPVAALKPEALDKYLKNGEHAERIMKIISDNNVYDWRPIAPMQLCFCEADEQVNYLNAHVAYKKMKENGSKSVRLRSGGKKFDHFQCSAFSSMNTKFFFETVRKGKKNGGKGNWFKRSLVSMAKTFNARYYKRTYNKQNMPLFMKH